MKNIRADSAVIVTINVVFLASLFRACVDSTIPIDRPVSKIANGTANHQWKQQVAAMAFAAIIAKQAVLSHPAI